MKIQLIKATRSVIVDGVSRVVDVKDMDSDIDTMWFDTLMAQGQVQYDRDPDRYETTKSIGKREYELRFAKYLQRWRAAAAVVRTLQQMKKDAKEQINARRDTLEQGGFMYMDNQCDSDVTAMARMALFAFVAKQVVDAGRTQNFKWSTKDDGQFTLTSPEMVAMPAALVEHIKTLRETARQKKTLINAATTAAEVAAVTWE